MQAVSVLLLQNLAIGIISALLAELSVVVDARLRIQMVAGWVSIEEYIGRLPQVVLGLSRSEVSVYSGERPRKSQSLLVVMRAQHFFPEVLFSVVSLADDLLRGGPLVAAFILEPEAAANFHCSVDVGLHLFGEFVGVVANVVVGLIPFDRLLLLGWASSRLWVAKCRLCKLRLVLRRTMSTLAVFYLFRDSSARALLNVLRAEVSRGSLRISQSDSLWTGLSRRRPELLLLLLSSCHPLLLLSSPKLLLSERLLPLEFLPLHFLAMSFLESLFLKILALLAV
uniref:Uncharacterized protein n=1 Tax=Strombidium inclinatum TaxID=197538 RepID=A0A7S3II94_9SPIT|mmetsp:Transcript_20417/g.31133  ORF Transcript_20417/g.31133 Transcript_20417/m.31133 type:complete len:283 (+) Transcript_20417:905-1753(+)